MEFMAILLGLAGVWAGVRGMRLFLRGLRQADDERASLWVVRGIRGAVVAVGTWALAAGLLHEQTWLLVFGAIFLAEELYETGVVALILRWRNPCFESPSRESSPPASPSPSGSV